MSEIPVPTVLDLAQLSRIQGTHGGYLYQHLYAAHCYLNSPRTGAVCVRVERDEDVEIVFDDRTVYVQIKHYSDPLSPSALKGLEQRFEGIRAAHKTGQRTGEALFAIVTSSGFGPTLKKKVWADDVTIVTPKSKADDLIAQGLSVPPPTCDELFARTQDLANGYLLSALRPASLVAKLVGAVARAAAGKGPQRVFRVDALNEFCELVAAQLHPLPTVSGYQAQVGEPEAPDEHGDGIAVVGHSGSGKSAWAANVASLSSDVVTYAPCSTTSDNISARVVQAIVATLAARGDVAAHELVLPGESGSATLSLLDREIGKRAISVTVILDDCHRASAEVLVDAVQAGTYIRWILVGRPSESMSEATALLGIKPYTLQGWDDDTIAQTLATEGLAAVPESVSELRRLTGGAPLFVLRAVRDIADSGKDVSSYCKQLTAGLLGEQTAQDRLLERVVAGLSTDSTRVAGAVSCVDTGFTIEEWGRLLPEVLQVPEREVGRCLRSLAEFQIVNVTVRGSVAVHDAFRSLLRERQLSMAESKAVRGHAVELLKTRLTNDGAHDVLVPIIRLLSSLGRMSELADMANAASDWVRDSGSLAEVATHVGLAVASGTLSDTDRFWALDTLVFFDMQAGNVTRASDHLAVMESLADRVGDEATGPILHKKMIVSAAQGNLLQVRRIARSAAKHPRYELVLRYHAAIAESRANHTDRAIKELWALATEYLGLLGLTPAKVLGANIPDIEKRMKPSASTDDIRRLADCYDAIVKTGGSRKHAAIVPIAAIWATKFYDMVGASRATLIASQAFVDVLLGALDDPEQARDFMEKTLLPALAKAPIAELSVPIRAQYAVVLAHCGEFAKSAEVFSRLDPYASGLPAEGAREYANQKALVDTIRANPPSSRRLAERRARHAEQRVGAGSIRRMLDQPQSPSRGSTAPGRNHSCPCGSRKRYKRCCGKAKEKL